jgi:hypothetical protein
MTNSNHQDSSNSIPTVEQDQLTSGVGNTTEPTALNIPVIQDTERTVGTDEYLEEQAHDLLAQRVKEILEQIGDPKASFDLATDDGRKAADFNQRLFQRKLVLGSQLIPMCVIPIWLMVILSLPAFGNKAYSEKMQAGFLAALATNALGLCYVIARDLFPLGKDDTDDLDQHRKGKDREAKD